MLRQYFYIILPTLMMHGQTQIKLVFLYEQKRIYLSFKITAVYYRYCKDNVPRFN